MNGGVYDDLLAEVCRQLEGHGLKLKAASAVIIDGEGMSASGSSNTGDAYARRAHREAIKGKPSAGRMPQMPDNPPDTRGAPCIGTRNRGDLVRESSTWASGRQTSPTANREINRNMISMGGIILQPPAPPCVKRTNAHRDQTTNL